jgi:hypothetical protein
MNNVSSHPVHIMPKISSDLSHKDSVGLPGVSFQQSLNAWKEEYKLIADTYNPCKAEPPRLLLNYCKEDIEERPTYLVEHPEAALLTVQKPLEVIRFCLPRLKYLFRSMCEEQNPRVLLCLVRLWHAISFVVTRDGFERLELREHSRQIVEKIKKMLKFRWTHSRECFHRVLLPQRYWPPSSYYHSDAYSNSILWCEMHAFEQCCFLRTCLDAELKFVFATPAVDALVTDLFYNNIAGSFRYGHIIPHQRRTEYSCYFRRKRILQRYRADLVLRMLYYPRYTPALMFSLEGSCKAVVLFLVGWVAVVVYGRHEYASFKGAPSEIVLVVMTAAQMIYELGQLEEINWDVRAHFCNVWNALDAVEILLLLGWVVVAAYNFDVARALLALSAIPLSLQMLQYLSLYREFGLLVLMVLGMTKDVVTVVAVYAVSVFGFGLCFYALYNGVEPFTSGGATALYLFQSTLGNANFNDIDRSKYSELCTAVLVVFLIFTAILLINLLIAKMSSTYERINQQSVEEWSFVKVSVSPLLVRIG